MKRSDIEAVDPRWSGFYKVGGAAALLVINVALLDIVMLDALRRGSGEQQGNCRRMV
jgi:hypothetical protein